MTKTLARLIDQLDEQPAFGQGLVEALLELLVHSAQQDVVQGRYVGLLRQPVFQLAVALLQGQNLLTQLDRVVHRMLVHGQVASL